MKQSVVTTASVRRGAASVLAGLAMLAAMPALAGDRALIELIGYSEDGRYFSFEEYGVQDGSGFAYSSIFIVDLMEDSWVLGTPVRMRADDENESLGDIRSAVRREAGDALETLDIAVPAEMVALVGDGAPQADGQKLTFGVPGYSVGVVNDVAELVLGMLPVPASAPCQDWFDTEPVGFELTLVEGSASTLLHRDQTLPRSRGCPQTYRLYGVALPFQASDFTSAVAIVSSYPGGFEGPDRRFIVVPIAH